MNSFSIELLSPAEIEQHPSLNLGREVYKNNWRWTADNPITLKGKLGPKSTFLEYCQLQHFAAMQDQRVLARCTAIINSHIDPKLQTAFVGFYDALPEPDDAGPETLKTACDWLFEQGMEKVIGPLNVNTWNRYRLVSDGSERNPFMLEPWNPIYYNTHFAKAGFRVQNKYFSSIFDINPGSNSSDMVALPPGLTLRSLDKNRFKDDVRIIYDISLKIFGENPLYTPIDWLEFWRMYEPARQIMDPELVCFIEDKSGNPVAFVFGLRDYSRAMDAMDRFPGFLGKLAFLKNRKNADTLIVKSLGVLPEFRQMKLGSYLVKHLNRVSAGMGLKHSIHALMEEDNYSRKLLTGGKTFRTYFLYQRCRNEL